MEGSIGADTLDHQTQYARVPKQGDFIQHRSDLDHVVNDLVCHDGREQAAAAEPMVTKSQTRFSTSFMGFGHQGFSQPGAVLREIQRLFPGHVADMQVIHFVYLPCFKDFDIRHLALVQIQRGLFALFQILQLCLAFQQTLLFLQWPHQLAPPQ